MENMENKKQRLISKLKFYAKSAVLAATTLVTGISCGTTENTKVRLDEGAYVVEAEENTENNIKVAMTGQSNLKEKFSDIRNQVKEYYIKNYKKYDMEKNIQQETPTENKTESKIESKTENKAQNKTEVKIESKTENKTEVTKENKKEGNGSSYQPAIGGHKVQSSKPITTTEAVTEQPATEPTTRVAYISKSERTDLTKYDMTSADELDAKTILGNMSVELAQELFNGYNQRNQYGALSGVDTAYGIIVNLNYNQNINIKALGDRYDCIPLEDFCKNVDNMNLAYYQYLYGTKVDFTKYTLDEELGQFINEITDKYLDYKNNNNIDPLYEEYDNFFENNQPYDNYAKYYFMVNTKNENNYNSEEMNTARDIFNDGVTYPLYNEISQNMGVIKRKIYY